MNIDKNNIFTYLFNTPIYTIDVHVNDDIFYKNINKDKDNIKKPYYDRIYIIPREGDILLDISIEGYFEIAELYQYDCLGNKIIYDTLEKSGIMNPFPFSGFPLNQMGKALYLEIKQVNKSKIIIKANYTLLDDKPRKLLIHYRCIGLFEKKTLCGIIKTHKSVCGIKIVHKNKDIYQVVGIEDCGYSPNFLMKLDK